MDLAPESQSVSVQIPEELASHLMQEVEVCGRYLTVRDKGNRTHRLAKFYGFYLLLKAEAPESGWIQDYARQIPTLSQHFGISQRTFFNYMRQLELLKLAFREGKNIRLIGWDQLAKQLDIDARKRVTVKFNYDGKQKVHWWFAAIEIQTNQAAQAYMIYKRVNKNSEIKNQLFTALINRGFDTSKANNPEYFAGQLFLLYIEDFQTGTEVHDILIRIRADVNRSVSKIADAWSMSPQLASYWKKIMTAQRIVDISKVTITSSFSRETSECHKNQFCHVIWNDKLKERVWFLCDQISVLMPWKWEEFLLKNAA